MRPIYSLLTMETKYINLWRALAGLSVAAAYVCYSSLATPSEIAIHWSWPIQLLAMAVVIAAGVNFARTRNTVMRQVAAKPWSEGKRWLGKLIVELAAMVALLSMLIPAVLIFNLRPDLLADSAEAMLYPLWLGFSVLAPIYFLVLQPLLDRLIIRHVS